ncbi:MAG: hypothetical protein Kow0029_23770 [Candidatus Rifleibacteriota bacterium]
MKENSNSNNFSIWFRKIFGLFFPLLYSFLLFFIFLVYYDSRQTALNEHKKNFWLQKANFFLASIQQRYKFSHLLRDSGNHLALKLEKDHKELPSVEVFSKLYQQAFSTHLERFIRHKWAFSFKDGRAEVITPLGFETTKRRVMEKVVETLNLFSTNKPLTKSEITKREKFVRGVFGKWCAPLVLGQKREGDCTPVEFNKSKSYLYWRKFSSDGETFGAILLILDEKPFARIEDSLQIAANNIFNESKKQIAVAFVPVKEFAGEKPIILPNAFDSNPEEKHRTIEILEQTKASLASKNEIKKIGNYLYIRDLFSVDSVYDAVAFAPFPNSLKTKPFNSKNGILIILAIWFLLYFHYYKKTAKPGLPIVVSFRLAFFLTGILPVAIMLVFGIELTEKTYQAEFLELKQKYTRQLANLNERSDKLLQLFSWHLAKLLQNEEIQSRIKTASINELAPIFQELRQKLVDKELDLSYLFAFEPGKAPKSYIADTRDYQQAKLFLDLLASSIFKINKDYGSLYGLKPIILTPSQKTWYDALKNLGRDFLQNIFIDAIEHESFLKFGNDANAFLYSTILSNNGNIDKYLIFFSNSEKLFRKYLRRELDSININTKAVFLAAEERSNSDFTLFPFKKMNVLNSKMGKNAFEFVKKCRGSIFPKYYKSKENLFIYYPITKFRRYATGVVVSLTDSELNRSKKYLALFSFSVIILIAMYMLASMASSYLFKPIKEIETALIGISKGNLDQQLESPRKDEIGLLIATLDKMQRGFKKRLKLGKFVSGTLEKQIQQNSNTHKADQAKTIQGTILFSDIRNFTSLSEKHPPDKIAEMLNYHLETMSAEIHAFNGQIEQFVGDAIIAVFIDNEIPESSRIMALNAAVAMRKKHDLTQKARSQKGSFVYEIGIGLEYGNLTTGTLTTEKRSEFVVLGEAKTLAEKYEALSKNGNHTKIIVSNGFSKPTDSGLDFVELGGSNLYEVKI